MSSTDTRVWTVAWKQYLYKLRSFSFIGLIVLQLIVLFFSSSGTGMYGAGNGNLYVSVKFFSSDIVIIATLIWIFVKAFVLTTKSSRNLDFTLVSNRFSSSLSDFGLLITLSLTGGVTSSLSVFLLRLVMYFTGNPEMIAYSSITLSPAVLFTGIIAAVFYLFLVSTVAYLFGVLVEVHKFSALVIPALLFGLLRVQNQLLVKGIALFTEETSLFAFSAKVLLTAVFLFALSSLIFNRMEVRR